MKNENNNIDKEFTDIDKEKINKTYIIVGFLYLLVIILSIFLILGIKNQKDTVKDNISKDEQIEDELIDIEKKEQSEDELIDIEEEKQSVNHDNDIDNNHSNNLFKDVHSQIKDYNSKENETMEDARDLLDQVR